MVFNIIIAIVIFGILVAFHEFGHFIAAKKCGVTVTEFSIGMGPRVFSVNKGGTKYSIKAVPFGGSCAMLGEDEDTTVEGSFGSKPVWKRMIIVFAGPFFNFILAAVAAVVLVMLSGTGKAFVSELENDNPAYIAGLRNGDHLISLNGHTCETLEELQYSLIFHPIDKAECEIKYSRDGEVNTVNFDAVSTKAYRMGFNFKGESSEPAEIGMIKPKTPIYEAGGRNGDVIVEINGTKIESGADFSKYISEHPIDSNDISLVLERKGKTMELTVSPIEKTVYDLNFSASSDRNGDGEPDGPSDLLDVAKYSFVNVRTKVTVVFESLRMLFTGEAGVDDMSGPVGIVAQMEDSLSAPTEHPIKDKIATILFWIVFLSTNLGVMNLLPLPALDGGRLFVNLIEVIIRRPINRTAEGIYHFAGFCVLMALMVALVFKDILSLI